MLPLLEGHVLSALIGLPAGTALALFVLGALHHALFGARGLPETVWRVAGLVATVLAFALAAFGILAAFDLERMGPQLVEYVPWVPSLGVHYFVGVDGISLFLVLLTTLLFPLAFVASWKQVDRSLRSFVLLILFLESGLLGVLLAQNTAFFFLAWQATWLPMFFLIGIFGGARRVRAATRFLMVSGFASACLLVALLTVSYLAGAPDAAPLFDLATPPGGVGPGLLDSPMIDPDGAEWLSSGPAWLFFAFVVAFGVMIPIVPFHAWLPDVLGEAPSAITALIAAVGIKLGAYGLLRFALPLCPASVAEWAPAFSCLATIAIVYGSLVAAVQTDLKRLVAWWTIAQLGLVLLGIFSLEVHGLTGSVILLSSHGLTVAALYFLVGSVIERRGTAEIVAYGGLARPMPVFAVLFGLAVLSAMGMPAFVGFVGGFTILLSSFASGPGIGMAALVGTLLTAGYWAWTYRRVALGPVENAENRGLIDLDWRERIVVIVLLLPLLWTGLQPGPVLRRVEPSVLDLLRQMDDRRMAPPPVDHYERPDRGDGFELIRAAAASEPIS